MRTVMSQLFYLKMTTFNTMKIGRPGFSPERVICALVCILIRTCDWIRA